MGNLSNLYISQSFVSLIHLATNEAATATSTELQDGLGNGIGVYVNTAGALSASVYSGSVAGIGNVSAFSSSVSSRINAISASGGIPAGTVSSSAQITALGFATTASVDALSTSVDSRLDALEFKDGTFVTTSSFASFTSSYFTDSSSVDSRLDSLEFADTTFVTTASFNTFSTSVDSRLDTLEAFSASSDARYVEASETSSMAVSSSLYAVTSSYSINAQTASEARNLIVIARNGNQSTLVAGTVVHITSASGDNPIFNTASFNDEALSANTFGIVRSTTTSGADCEVVVNGIVTGVNTDPANGYVAGDIIYLSASGQYTRVQPQAPQQIVALGQVLRANQNQGSIYVSITNGWELNELHNVQINTPLTNDILAYESSSYGLWKNKSFSSLGLATTGSNSFSGSQIVSGSLVVTGSVKGNISTITISSNTASIDFSLGSFFNLQLVSSSVPTFVTATNVKAGTTANLLVTQASTLSGSLRWDSNFKFPSGSSYTGSVSSSAKDIVSFVMYDDTTIYSVGAKNLI
jgi:hypothetical protein